MATSRRSVSRFLTAHEAATQVLTIQARKAWGDWLGTIPWDHWGTLTFAYAATEEMAAKQFRKWVRWVEQRVQGPVEWFYRVERGAGGRVHLHVLTKGTAAVGATGLIAAWQEGKSEVEGYSPRGGASRYVSKQLGEGAGYYDIHLPRI